MQRVRKKGCQKGFTLLELLIAISLLAIGLLAVATMQVTAINANAIANRHTTVATLAQEVMEDILSWNPDPTKEARFGGDTADVVYDLDPNTAGDAINIPGIGTCTATYSIERDPTIPPIGGTLVPWFVKIDVTVTGGLPAKTVSISSYKQLRQP
jgi:type IV pilus assembly protein PilV